MKYSSEKSELKNSHTFMKNKRYKKQLKHQVYTERKHIFEKQI